MTGRRAFLAASLCAFAGLAAFLLLGHLGSDADVPATSRPSADASTNDLERAMTFTQPEEPAR